MAEMKSHVNLIEDTDIGYQVDGPARMYRTVFWGDNILMGRNVLPAGEHVPACGLLPLPEGVPADRR